MASTAAGRNRPYQNESHSLPPAVAFFVLSQSHWQHDSGSGHPPTAKRRRAGSYRPIAVASAAAGGNRPYRTRDLTLRQLSQHCVQDTAVAVVVDFNWCVDAAGGDEVDFFAVCFASRDFHSLT